MPRKTERGRPRDLRGDRRRRAALSASHLPPHGPSLSEILQTCDYGPRIVGPSVLSKHDAVALMLSRVSPVAGTETVSIHDGLGRVLAAPLVSGIDVPCWPSSAMDGYALRWADIADCGGRLRVTQRIAAGEVGVAVVPGTAARIFTGAPVPPGADVVVVQEMCSRIGDHVLVPVTLDPGANVRRAGEDVRAGAQAIAEGVRLAPQHLGLAASLGLTAVSVHRRLRVAIVSTGNELAAPGELLGPGQMYNSNRFMLAGLLRGFGCEVVDLGMVRDALSPTVAALARGGRMADLVISSGGVSVGEEDYVGSAVKQIGSLDFCKVAIRPGKSVAFGRIGRTPFFGGSGNPVALFVTFCLFVRPILLRMQGVAGDLAPGSFQVRAGFDWPEPDKRSEYQRARVLSGVDGTAELAVYPKRSTAILSSVGWSEGLAEIPEGRAIRRGDPVTFLPLRNLLS